MEPEELLTDSQLRCYLEKNRILNESKPNYHSSVQYPRKVIMTPEELMAKGMELMKSKSHDYTTNDRYENFERQAELISWFKDSTDQAFIAVIAIKLARLASLLGRDKEVKNESIQDTFIDLINYCSLWGGYCTKDIIVDGVRDLNIPIHPMPNPRQDLS